MTDYSISNIEYSSIDRSTGDGVITIGLTDEHYPHVLDVPDPYDEVIIWWDTNPELYSGEEYISVYTRSTTQDDINKAMEYNEPNVLRTLSIVLNKILNRNY